MRKPVLLNAPLKDYLWGGKLLKEEYGKESDLEIVAESWELSGHKDGLSVIASGEYAGKTLDEYIAAEGRGVIGSNCKDSEGFPILVKLIDAAQSLSVQVHPDNEYARIHEGEPGKTEMWYIVDCKEGAKLLYGFKKNVSKEEFVSRIKDNTLLEITNDVPVKKGDVFFIEAGTLHAIGEGILIAEVQQSSNSTYRIYDFGRVGADGKPRELHIDKAVDVTKLEPPTRDTKPFGNPEKKEDATVTLLAECDYFTTEDVKLEGKVSFVADETSFNGILCLDGEAVLEANGEKLTLKKGMSAFVPAGTGEYTLNGKADLLRTRI